MPEEKKAINRPARDLQPHEVVEELNLREWGNLELGRRLVNLKRRLERLERRAGLSNGEDL